MEATNSTPNNSGIITIRKTCNVVIGSTPEYECFFRNYELINDDKSIGSIVYNRFFKTRIRNTSAHILSISSIHNPYRKLSEGILLESSIKDLMLCFPTLKEVCLHSDPETQSFYARHGFVPYDAPNNSTNMIRILNKNF